MGTTTEEEREVRVVRVLKAPRTAVFRALTEPALLQRWWGPKGFTNTFHAFEPKPGGSWEFTMHGPDGTAFPNSCVFRRIVAPELLEFDHLGGMHFYTALLTLADVEGGTRLEWTMRFRTVEELAPLRAFIAAANEENLDKLGFLLMHEERSAPGRNG